MMIILFSGCGTNLTKEDIVNRAFDEEMKSFEVDSNIKVEMESNGQSRDQSFDLHMRNTYDTFFAHVKITSVEGIIELYMDNDITYLLNPGEDQWKKIAANSVPEIKNLASETEILKEELKIMKHFSNLFVLTYKFKN